VKSTDICAVLVFFVTTHALFASKNTLSAFVGTGAPQGHQDVSDRFAHGVASQIFVPPTQYLFAILDYNAK
jgi:hypothetical protein